MQSKRLVNLLVGSLFLAGLSITTALLQTPPAYAGCDIGDRLDPFNRNCPVIGPERGEYCDGYGCSPRDFGNAGISPPDAIRRMYREILERDVDPTGMKGWINALNTGWSLAQVRRGIAESPEAQRKLNDLYRRMLCRDIDSLGRAGWTNALANGWTLQQVANQGIVPSQEYKNRGGRACY